jgi:DNA-directed RNA polymerase subunit M/transcription elongation factor TFIIS
MDRVKSSVETVKMKFCPECKNVLYSIEEESGHAVQKCRKCEYQEKISPDHPIVYEHVLREDTSAKLVLNPYLKYDPTLPRFSEIQCPAPECPSRSGKKADVVGVKIDRQNVIWMYQCANCDTTWKQNAQAT